MLIKHAPPNEATDLFEVFYAEDLPSDRLLFRIALAEAKIEAQLTTAEEGAEAMRQLLADNYTPDVIFLDVKMPFKNGLECLREIRSEKKFDVIPVVMFSSSIETEDLEKAYSSKANLYVQKPISLEETIVVFQKLFSLRRKDYFPQPARENFVWK